jgi:alpha-1,6-mannosyl-glycoprotein beta-1,2-N-acetylglucosaminyltransferase
VLFLEEDHYVTEDFLHVLRLTNEERLLNHKDAEVICLGTYLKTTDYKKTSKQVCR